MIKQGLIVLQRAVETKSDTASDVGNESDEFEGFDDEPNDRVTHKLEGPEHSKSDAEAKDSAPSKKETKSDKKAKKSRQVAQDPELEANVFAALEDVDEVTEDFDASAWVPLEISPALISSIAKLKFSNPTAIQTASIPLILAGHDVIGKASTGSGKTLAFAIPVVEKWLDNQSESEDGGENNGPIALILSPTRELAHQLTDHIKALCQGLPSSPYVCSVTGGLSVHKQQRQLSKADIVIGTPGRLWEVLSSSSDLMSKFKGISFLVVDEADRLLSEGHFKEAEQLFDALDRYEADENEQEEHEPTPRQTLVFSATFHKGLQQKLAGKGKHGLMNKDDSMEYLLKKLNFREERPKFVDVNPISQMAKGLKEGLVECGAMEKVRSYSSSNCF
jgi:ATP-dependent RNA helicase DDX24/MAK5